MKNNSENRILDEQNTKNNEQVDKNTLNNNII